MKLSEETQRLSVAAGGGAFVGVVLTVLAYRLFGAPGAEVPRGARGSPLGPAPSAASSGPAAAAGATLTVSTPGPRHAPARLRVARSPGAKVVALVPAGTVVKVADHASDAAGHRWYQVAVDGKSGWIHGDVLS